MIGLYSRLVWREFDFLSPSNFCVRFMNTFAFSCDNTKMSIFSLFIDLFTLFRYTTDVTCVVPAAKTNFEGISTENINIQPTQHKCAEQ